MLRTLFIVATSLATVGLSACAVHAPGRDFPSVLPGKFYAGKILNITAPNSEGWSLLESSPSGMAFARDGNAPGESFAAAVVKFDPPQTDSPKEFEALIVQGAQRDAETDRFSTIRFTHRFTSVRGYPCVEMQNVSEDRQAQVGLNRTETLLLQNEHLYCRHPVHRNIGFAITYSHRGRSLHPDFENEAHAFIDGVQVPRKPSSQ